MEKLCARRLLTPAVVVDTHSILWYLAKDPALSKTARTALNEASSEGNPIYVPSICLVELTYLVEKARLPAVARERLILAIDDPNGPVPRSEVPDLPDRIVAATAVALKVQLVSGDRKIRASVVRTIW